MLKFLALVGFAGTFFVTGYLFSWPSAYAVGLTQGRQEPQNVKSIVLKDPKAASSLCRAWWFDATHKERRVK